MSIDYQINSFKPLPDPVLNSEGMSSLGWMNYAYSAPCQVEHRFLRHLQPDLRRVHVTEDASERPELPELVQNSLGRVVACVDDRIRVLQIIQ